MLGPAKDGWRSLRRRVAPRRRNTGQPHDLLDAAVEAATARRREIDEQGRRLVAAQQAAEMQLNTRLAELSSLVGRARALLSDPQHDPADATGTAELDALAERVIELDHSVRQSIQIVTGLAEAVDRTRAELRQNARESQRLIAERSRLLTPLEQARQRDRLDRTMQALAEPLRPHTDTAAEIERKLSGRHAAAKRGDLHEPPEPRAVTGDTTAEARDWLAELRANVDGGDAGSTG